MLFENNSIGIVLLEYQVDSFEDPSGGFPLTRTLFSDWECATCLFQRDLWVSENTYEGKGFLLGYLRGILAI